MSHSRNALRPMVRTRRGGHVRVGFRHTRVSETKISLVRVEQRKKGAAVNPPSVQLDSRAAVEETRIITPPILHLSKDT
jgi:hypothetical protein